MSFLINCQIFHDRGLKHYFSRVNLYDDDLILYVCKYCEKLIKLVVLLSSILVERNRIQDIQDTKSSKNMAGSSLLRRAKKAKQQFTAN